MRKGGSTHSTAVAPHKPDRRRNEYKQMVKEVFHPEDFLRVLEVLKQKALDGDTKSIEMIMHYVVGRPTEKMQVTQIEPKQFEVHVVDDTYCIGDMPAIKFADK